MNPKTMAYVGVIVVLAGIAVWRFSSAGGGDASLPNDDASKSAWMCEKCLNTFSLTPREEGTWVKAGKYLKQKDSLSKSLVLQCEKCGTFTCVRAEKCTTHNKYYALYHVDGSGGVCKECEKLTLEADKAAGS
ncbi:MAG: hypothetical protein U1D55_11750 [Phycisphaerae bacterium]